MRFGETLLTATREGADQSESANIEVSLPHRSGGERTNESGRSPKSTSPMRIRFGETTMTETREGADQSETASMPTQDVDAAHSHF